MAPPANDNWANAITLTPGRRVGPINTADATAEVGEPFTTSMGEGPYQTTWYKWTPVDSGEVIVDLNGSTGYGGPGPDAEVGIWTGASLGTLVEHESFGVNESFPEGIVTVAGGTTYYIQVGSFGGDTTMRIAILLIAASDDIAGVSVAPDAAWNDATPVWYDLRQIPSFVRSINISRGRQDELTKTGTGTADISVNDEFGYLDPTRSANPFRANFDVLKPMAIALRNPVTDESVTIYRGFIESFSSTVAGSQVVTFTDVQLVDMFDILGAVEVAPGAAFGQTPPAQSAGDVFYEDASPGPQVRIEGALDEADVPAALYLINSGNVSIQETVYAPGTSILTICQDAADAEFPGVANLYVSKEGIVRFTGRQPRFRPAVVEYDIDTWVAGDGTAIGFDDTIAQIRGLVFSRQKEAIINAALATPQIFDADETEYQANITAALVSDATSILQYGVRTWTAENLLTDTGLATGNDKWEETNLFATYYVANYKDPQVRVRQIVFKSVHPDDPRAAATWALICGVELNDIITLHVQIPGGGEFNGVDFFVEGITYEIAPLDPDYDDVTLTLDVTPRAHYNTNPFDGDPDP